MPRIRKVSNADQERQDEAEVLKASVAAAYCDNEKGPCDEDAEEDSNLVAATVKTKLSTFCPDPAIRRRLNAIVMDGNRLLAEGYKLAELHVLRLLTERPQLFVSAAKEAPKMAIDRNLYYRCLVGVGAGTAVKEETMNEDMLQSISEFDALRPANQPKVDTSSYNQLLADLSIQMATMASNHLWMNLDKRLIKFLDHHHGNISRPLRKGIHIAVALEPVADIDAIFQQVLQLHRATATAVKLQEAKDVAEHLRTLMPLPSKQRWNNRAHLTLPLYRHILSKTEAARDNATEQQEKKKHQKTFNLLPNKGGFCTSYIPVSTMLLHSVLKKMNVEKPFASKTTGTVHEHSVMWRKHFNVNSVETRERLFDNRVVTDGYGVSVLMQKPTCLVLGTSKKGGKRSDYDDNQDGYTRTDLRVLLADDGAVAVAVDPGISDIVTSASTDPEDGVKSYSSARYYEKAHYNTSRRCTDRWNQETSEIVTENLTLPDQTSDMEVLRRHLSMYLEWAPRLLKHRALRGYRSMRFLRFVGKQKAIDEICEMVAPKDRVNVVGFGDWSGLGGGSPVRRRCAGPLQEIKLRLKNRPNVVMRLVPECKTSQNCSCCWGKLVNMKAASTRVDRYTGEAVTEVTKVHKVLHCKSSLCQQPTVAGRGTTWNRDVNAAKNMLMLHVLEIKGWRRPLEFCPSKKTAPKRTTRKALAASTAA